MKRTILLLLYVFSLIACNNNSKPEPIAKDSIQKSQKDSFHSNPAMPSAQNSDDPDRFSQ